MITENTEEETQMEDGYRNWPIVRKLLIDNRLEHAALLAYSIGVPSHMFAARALAAFKRTEVKVAESVHAANEAVEEMRSRLHGAIKAEEEKLEEKGPEPAPEPPKAEEP